VAAANIPAINKMNPTANQRSSGLINGNIRDAYFGLPQGYCAESGRPRLHQRSFNAQ
jgi:hypothetical protein